MRNGVCSLFLISEVISVPPKLLFCFPLVRQGLHKGYRLPVGSLSSFVIPAASEVQKDGFPFNNISTGSGSWEWRGTLDTH